MERNTFITIAVLTDHLKKQRDLLSHTLDLLEKIKNLRLIAKYLIDEKATIQSIESGRYVWIENMDVTPLYPEPDEQEFHAE